VVLGHVGVVDPTVTESVGSAGTVVAFELDVDALVASPRRDRTFVAPSPYPPSTIDLSFVVDEGVPAAALVTTVSEAAGALLEDVRVFDEFRSEALGPGRRSLTLSLTFRASDRTLTDEEVGEVRARAVAAAAKAHGAELRG
jgi:phenylalanyl-tRNA synthetase beta chain